MPANNTTNHTTARRACAPCLRGDCRYCLHGKIYAPTAPGRKAKQLLCTHTHTGAA